MENSSKSSRTIDPVASRRARITAVAVVPLLAVGLSLAPVSAYADEGVDAAPQPTALRLAPTTVASYRAPALTLQTDTSATTPPRRGLGLLISGAVVTGTIGLPFTIWGSVIAAAGSRSVDGGGVLGAPFLAVGIIGLGVGVPLLAVGAHRMKKYNQWKSQHAFVPTAGRTAMGTWTGGVSFSF